MKSILGNCYHGDPHCRDVIDSKANGTISLSHVTTETENKSQQVKASEAIALFRLSLGFGYIICAHTHIPTAPLTYKTFKIFLSLFYVYQNLVCMCVCAECMGPMEVRRGHLISSDGANNGWESLCGFWN